MPDAAAGRLSAERSRRGVAGHARVHGIVGLREIPDPPAATLTLAASVFEGRDDEPDLYTAADFLAARRYGATPLRLVIAGL